MKKMDVEAKKSMLQKLKGDMREIMHGELPEKLKGKVKKVVVESDSPEGLDKGLSMAQKILKGKLSQEDSDMSDMMECESEDEEEEDEYNCGGKEKYMEGGVEQEEDSSFMKKYMKGFQGTKPMEKQASIDAQSDEKKKMLAGIRKSFN